MRVIGVVWAVDASLAPLGFLAAIAARQGYAAILFAVPLVFLLCLLARDRDQRIEQAHHRLKLVERERARLQIAVRRLGDAFAAKLDLDGLLEILLHGSIEALDADAGRLDLAGGPSPLDARRRRRGLAGAARARRRRSGVPDPGRRGRRWTLTLPMRIAASPWDVTGSLRFVRHGRAFDADEIALIAELIAKAELSAAEIIAHQAIRQQAMTDPLTGLGQSPQAERRPGRGAARPMPVAPSLLLLFDLDGFKDYNDTFGHLAGDALLARLGRKLQRGRGRLRARPTGSAAMSSAPTSSSRARTRTP